MPRTSKANQIANMEIDMTPMIDVIFNLIIFFMLINRMVQDERPELMVPRADQAKPEDKTDEKNQLVINIHAQGKEHKQGDITIGPMERISLAKLRDILKEETKDPKLKNQDGSCNRSVLIRADRDTEYRYVQQVLLECAQKKLYKISFSAEIP